MCGMMVESVYSKRIENRYNQALYQMNSKFKNADEWLQERLSKYSKYVKELDEKYNLKNYFKTDYKKSDLDANEIWNSIDPKERELVADKNLMELDILGKPIYQVAKGAKDGKYHIYKNGRAVVETEYGNNVLYDFDKKAIEKVGEDKENIYISMIQAFQKKGNITKYNYQFLFGMFKSKGFYLNTKGDTLSPLVIDYNQDGKVSAEANKGIDINNDGKADGCATNGDKMLAMSDINGNGKIDGAEVFGNKTINPFTKKAINAKNGFEALKEIAKSAERKTGIICFDGKNVKINNLKLALLTQGINLGFVSGNNNIQLEQLSKIDKINVTNYMETPESGKIQHNQKGYGTMNDGTITKVNDVWFNA